MIVTRQDLSPGYQCVQPAHALAQFATEHLQTFREWHDNHKNLIVLATDDEESLTDLWILAKAKGIATSVFREPDIGNEVTAIAFAPGKKTEKLLSNIPLALKQKGDQLAESSGG